MKRWINCFILCSVCADSARAGDVQVAVAASLAQPMQKIAAAFNRETGHRAVVSVGSTGKLYAQIKNGAPFQVLLAADDETPARLEKEGATVAGTRFTYAVGKLVLWSPQLGLVDSQGAVLKAPGAQPIAMADPRLAPYGAAALEVLGKLGLQAALQPRLVQGENMAQAHQFVVSGNASMGFVALSQVWQDSKLNAGSAWVIPQTLYTPLRQDAVLLNAGQSNPAANALLAFLRSPPARDILLSYGYSL
jgi:molybdate transport system substrate-binding protein